ncbi:hypothetical protein JCM8547_008377 [Rhodosporidiobolus lusitaniae]
MHISPCLALVALSILSTLSLALPSPSLPLDVDLTKRSPSNGRTGGLYSGTLYSPSQGETITILAGGAGQGVQASNFSFSYDASATSSEPHYPVGITSLDVGLQGPGPVFPLDGTNGVWEAWGVLDLAKGLDTGGPGGWVNETLTIPADALSSEGTYYLIVTEHQQASYIQGVTYTVQSYNVTLDLQY